MNNLVHQLIKDAARWADRFAAFNPDDINLAWRLNLEIFTYSLVLIQSTRRESGGSEHGDARASFIQAACHEFIRQNPDRTGDADAIGRRIFQHKDFCLVLDSAKSNEDVFRDFCATTGMASPELAADGANLASLLLYISIFSLVTRYSDLDRDRKNAVLAACRMCKDHFSRLVATVRFEEFPLELPGTSAARMARPPAQDFFLTDPTVKDETAREDRRTESL